MMMRLAQTARPEAVCPPGYWIGYLVNRAQQRHRKATQFQRIRSAMIEVAATRGYARQASHV